MSGKNLHFRAARPGQRLDHAILAQLGEQLSRTRLQALIAAGEALVDGRRRKAGWRLRGGEQIALRLPPPAGPWRVAPESIALSVLYEDESLVVIDKPAGMIVHPGDHDERGTLVAAALARWPALARMPGESKRAGIVHRLDKDTSGLILLALEDSARRHLMRQFQERSVEKRYLALLETRPPAARGRIAAPLARDPHQRKRMAVQRGGREAISEYELLDGKLAGGRALVRVRLLTGRTHQIRAHMAFIGCPIIGDRVYGYRKQRLALARHFLHATELVFAHPHSEARMQFASPLPPDLQATLDSLQAAP